MVGDVAVRIRSYMYIEKKGFAVLHQPVCVLEVGLPLADRLDLGAAQGNACFVLLDEKVVVAGRPVLRRIAVATGHRIAWPHRLLRAGAVLRSDHVAGLARHSEDPSNLHRSIGTDATSLSRRGDVCGRTCRTAPEIQAPAGLC